jgi:signal transduction histidine kinase
MSSPMGRGTVRRWVTALVEAGNTPALDPGLRKRIVLTNKVVLTNALLLVAYVPFYVAIGKAMLGMGLVLIALGYLGVVRLNRHGRHMLGRLLMMTLASTAAAFYTVVLGTASGVPMLYFLLACIPFIFFEPKDRAAIIYGLTLPVVCYLLLELEVQQVLHVTPLDLGASIMHGLPISIGLTSLGLLIAEVWYLYVANARAETQLARSLDQLREETAERRRQQALIEEERVRHARAAGMAEIATSVLHNVGNVLNSVNVSAGMLRSRVTSSKAVGVGKAAELMREHADDYAAFFAAGGRGPSVVAYLGALADTLEQERTSMLEELASLDRSVEHIKSVVSMQQRFAKPGASEEALQPRVLVAEAVGLCRSLSESRGVDIVCEGEELPRCVLDRHKIAQVLVNLVTNAVDAVQRNAAGERRVVVRCVRSSDERLRFEVKDNGCGIAPEYRVGVFSHGFTTKPQGHGFGLHYSACAAIEMEGTLTCESEGVGLGALFVLELPLVPEDEAAAA